MGNVPEIPQDTEQELEGATQKILAESEQERAAAQVEAEQARAAAQAEQEKLIAGVQAALAESNAALQAEQAEQEKTLLNLLSSRFPGLKGEQAVLVERYLLGLGDPQAFFMVLNLTLPELLDAAEKASTGQGHSS